jgi:hypothetical protein
MMNQVYTSYVIVRQLPTQGSVTWVSTLWNQVNTMTPPYKKSYTSFEVCD